MFCGSFFTHQDGCGEPLSVHIDKIRKNAGKWGIFRVGEGKNY